jgi:hypothetical protein
MGGLGGELGSPPLEGRERGPDLPLARPPELRHWLRPKGRARSVDGGTGWVPVGDQVKPASLSTIWRVGVADPGSVRP